MSFGKDRVFMAIVLIQMEVNNPTVNWENHHFYHIFFDLLSHIQAKICPWLYAWPES